MGGPNWYRGVVSGGYPMCSFRQFLAKMYRFATIQNVTDGQTTMTTDYMLWHRLDYGRPKSCERILTKFLGGVGHGPGIKGIHFGDDPDHRPDPGVRSPYSLDYQLCWCSAEVCALWALRVFGVISRMITLSSINQSIKNTFIQHHIVQTITGTHRRYFYYYYNSTNMGQPAKQQSKRDTFRKSVWWTQWRAQTKLATWQFWP